MAKLLTSFCKSKPSAYDVLQNEIGYFDGGTTRNIQQHTKQTTASTKKYTYNGLPQTAEALVDRLNKDKSKVDAMTDAFGQEIMRKSIAKREAFLTENGITF